jgi:UDP-2,3-diacylglucosamine pyrophosphatase LpxH
MLVVLSDLHFEEERSDNIPGDGEYSPIRYSRNLPGKAYRRFFVHLAAEAIRNNAEKLELVLAGDIFDINRTSLWFLPESQGIRPYVDIKDVDLKLEERILFILKAIKEEEPVAEALTALKLLAKGKYQDGGEKRFPVPVNISIIPGNHDRMINASTTIRRFIRSQLGIKKNSAPFAHVLTFPQEGAIVRHGHEYDRYNFSLDLSRKLTIPLELPESAYYAAPFGDIATIDLASRLPSLFRQHHGDGKILADPVLRQVYKRLLDFDDLRPQRAMLNYLLHTTGDRISQVDVWNSIEPIILKLLEEIHEDPFLEYWLEKMDKRWKIDAIDVVQTALTLKSWRLTGIPLALAKFTSNSVLSSEQMNNNVPEFVAKEEMIQQGAFKFLIAGHTHNPTTEMVACDDRGERYYIDTGTWRNRVAATYDYNAFGRLKSMSYVIVYGPNEDPGGEDGQSKIASFDFWSGVTQRWYEEK